ncbi:MAG: 3-hydroxyacyl-ACP dehydratase [Oscillospiraceae bacterium]|nr:3-hydroxyacyl-ACP dehydratase [Oscillospiraceae bacterium]
MKIGFVCKYTPAEVFEAMGDMTGRIEPQVSDFNRADTMMHPNVCSYAKAVLEEVMAGDWDGVVLTTCCDSIRRLYDVLKNALPDKFIYLLDVPRKVNDFTAGLYAKRIRAMLNDYQAFCGKTLDETELSALLERQRKAAAMADAPTAPGKRVKLGILGARCPQGVRDILRESGGEVVFDLTCTGLNRSFPVTGTEVLTGYAGALLSQFPCMRMADAVNRPRYWQQMETEVDGILYHTVQFCDNFSFEYSALKASLSNRDKPLLELETDCTPQAEGQIRTRLQAFLEALGAAKPGESGAAPITIRKGTGKPMMIMGIDSGSTSTNAVILDENKRLLAHAVVRTGAKSGESAQKILEMVLERANLKREDLSAIISTGYGRVSIPFADANVTEISCHGRGAHYFDPSVRTILDIGGQDSKAIRLSEQGEVKDFVMNDKCAAGTGRFLEMMARTLELPIEELGPVSLQWTEEVEISSMCSVFAESEVISLIARNKEKADIAHGVHKAIAGRAYSLMRRVGLTPKYMMTGGVAKNPGVVKAVEEKLGDSLVICPEPEIVGAVGAALWGLEQA